MLSGLNDLYRIYKDVPVGALASLMVRALRLRGGSQLTARPVAGSAAQAHGKDGAARRKRLVISLTTTPARIDRIRPVLNSLIDQDTPADAILLAVPRFSRRENVEYRIPGWLDRSGALTILRCDDWGPATKLIPALMQETDGETLLLTVDDDVIYPPDLVSTFHEWHSKYPDAALGYRGWSLPKSLRWQATKTLYATSARSVQPVDVLTGTWGYLVQPRFFDRGVFDYSGYPRAAYFVDDIWFNGHLARGGVPRLLVPGRLPPLSTRIGRVRGLTFLENRDGTTNNEVIRAFAEHWTCNAGRKQFNLAADRNAA